MTITNQYENLSFDLLDNTKYLKINLEIVLLLLLNLILTYEKLKISLKKKIIQVNLFKIFYYLTSNKKLIIQKCL